MDALYKSSLNAEVELARPDEFKPVPIGPLTVWPPVALAPMAGVTNPPFRTMCRNFGAGLYISEMITARPLVESNQKTLHLASFGADEKPRSLQLYGVDPYYVGEAVNKLVAEGRVDHIDMNFGCPVPKVTRRGGGAAIPAKPNLLRNIVRAAVKRAERVPITIKFRMGIDDTLMTYLDAGLIGEEEGCAAVSLHARTAAQLYSGDAQWDAIAALKQRVKSIPVLGNGDIWEAEDALRMMRQTGCDGVVVGRGCLGRPWLFRDLADAFGGQEPQNPPTLRGVFSIMIAHAHALIDWMAEGGMAAFEETAMRMFRKHTAWYTKGFRGSAQLRQLLVRVRTLDELRKVLDDFSAHAPDESFPAHAMRMARGKASGTQRVALPEGFLNNRGDATPPEHEDDGEALSGG